VDSFEFSRGNSLPHMIPMSILKDIQSDLRSSVI